MKILVTKNEKASSKIILIYKHATTNLTCTNISSYLSSKKIDMKPFSIFRLVDI